MSNPRRPRQFKMLLSDKEWDDLSLVAEFEDLSASDLLRTVITQRAYELRHAAMQDFRRIADTLADFSSRLRAVAAMAEMPTFRALGKSGDSGGLQTSETARMLGISDDPSSRTEVLEWGHEWRGPAGNLMVERRDARPSDEHDDGIAPESSDGGQFEDDRSQFDDDGSRLIDNGAPLEDGE